MFCPKCGKELSEEMTSCDSCGFLLSERENGGAINSSVTENSPGKNKKSSSVIQFFYFALSAITLILSFVAASSVSKGGLDIAGIQSVGGKTLEEAFYQYSGSVYAGYSNFMRASGIFFASVLAYLGIKG